MTTKDIVFYHSYNNQKGVHGSLSATLVQEHPHQLRNGKIYYGNKCIVIGSLYVDSKLRNKGIGSILLDKIIQYAKNNRVKKIVLDDMTDNYRQSNNIYLKHGFTYLNEDGPEMEYFVSRYQ